MENQISTLLFDYRLDQVPSVTDIIEKVVKPIEVVIDASFYKIEGKLTAKTNQIVYLFETRDDIKDFTLLFRVYNKTGLGDNLVRVTASLEYPSSVESLVTNSCSGTLEEMIEEKTKGNFGRYAEDYVRWYPALMRCIENSPYLRTSDDRLIQYGFKDVLFRQRSSFQFIQIVQTVDFGALLILDDYTNLAEKDTEAYTHSVMNLKNENYADKEILILGGGDGALMKELCQLSNPPKFTTMVDIDDVVMEACSKHMRSVCGNYMDKDNRESSKHKVITGCAINFLKNAISEGKKYDYIFGDLTDTPVSTSPRDNDIWNFLKMIISMGLQVLKPKTGKYMTHCNGKNVPKSIESYEQMLRGLSNGKCYFTKTECFVPSFMETWMYYQISKEE